MAASPAQRITPTTSWFFCDLYLRDSWMRPRLASGDSCNLNIINFQCFSLSNPSVFGQRQFKARLANTTAFDHSRPVWRLFAGTPVYGYSVVTRKLNLPYGWENAFIASSRFGISLQHNNQARCNENPGLSIPPRTCRISGRYFVVNRQLKFMQ